MREEHVKSAVAFLREPQVASAALAKKVEFLESKGLTSEEINEALRQADSASSSSSATDPATQSGHATPSNPSVAPVAIPPRPSYMLQQPPPIPQRDWKDYFVMATVSAGVAYGLYECARRYVLPMILPPSPPALEADKRALEEEFQRTEQLLKQVQADTEELKKQEEARTQTFDAVMDEARKVILQLKQHVDDNKQESKLALSNVETLRDTIPRALKQHSESQARAVEALQSELLSLKTLINRRGGGSTGPSIPPASAVPSSLPGFPRKSKKQDSEPNGTKPEESANAQPQQQQPQQNQSTNEPEPFVPDPQSRIPEWQRAAAPQ